MDIILIAAVSVFVIGILVRFIAGMVVRARRDMNLDKIYEEVLTADEYKVKGRFA